MHHGIGVGMNLQFKEGQIHCHGLAKLDNDPDLCDLTQVALKGFLASQKNPKKN
jgi:hypothetical protein